MATTGFQEGLLAAVAEAGSGPVMPSTGGFGWKLLETATLLLAVCLIAYVAIRLLSRRRSLRGQVGAMGRLEVLDHLSLEPKRSLWVVRAGSRVLLVGLGDAGPTTLAELVAEEWQLDPEVPETPFSRVLGRVLRRRAIQADPSTGSKS